MTIQYIELRNWEEGIKWIQITKVNKTTEIKCERKIKIISNILCRHHYVWERKYREIKIKAVEQKRHTKHTHSISLVSFHQTVKKTETWKQQQQKLIWFFLIFHSPFPIWHNLLAKICTPNLIYWLYDKQQTKGILCVGRIAHIFIFQYSITVDGTHIKDLYRVVLPTA